MKVPADALFDSVLIVRASNGTLVTVAVRVRIEGDGITIDTADDSIAAIRTALAEAPGPHAI